MLAIDHAGHPGWQLKDIDFHALDVRLVHDDALLFYMLASASFVEILSELYSRNLIQHFRDDASVVGWLDAHWQREEMQHGRALKLYVQTAWPEFDWERTHQGFIVEYAALCTAQQLEPSRALELVARCVVETGTTTFYRALHDYVQEPVLRTLLGNIMADETRHYRYFRQYFETYNQRERHGAWAVLQAIWRRIREIQAEDSYIAFKHVYAGRHPGQPFHPSAWRRYSKRVRWHARHYYPFAMALKMLARPIPLAPPLKNLLRWCLLGFARLMAF